jgi:hypothetical protein
MSRKSLQQWQECYFSIHGDNPNDQSFAEVDNGFMIEYFMPRALKLLQECVDPGRADRYDWKEMIAPQYCWPYAVDTFYFHKYRPNRSGVAQMMDTEKGGPCHT